MRLFSKESDYVAFEGLLEQTCESRPMRICAYCLMPNHWHFVLWPEHDGELGAFMQRLTTTHVRRWHLHRKSVGCGHLYQGTYKSFPIEADELITAATRCRQMHLLRCSAEAGIGIRLNRGRPEEIGFSAIASAVSMQ